jgi:hypothetical protein
MDLLSLIVACAPFVSSGTMSAFVQERSHGNPYAIHDSVSKRSVYPKDEADAIATARRLIASGHRIDAGLAQIGSAEWPALGLSVETVFDPCRNLAAAERLLVANHEGRSVAGTGGAAPGDIARLVHKLAPEYALSPALVLALVEVESGFDPKARSPKRAQGLMQLVPATAERFGVGNVWDPEQNLRGGMAYLRWLLDRFDGDVALALAGYNAGERAVERHGGIPPYAETRAYVRKVMSRIGKGTARWTGQGQGRAVPARPKAAARALLFELVADGFAEEG